MRKRRLNQKGNMQLIVALIIIVAIITGVYLVQQRTNFLPKASSPYNTYQNTSNQTINNPSDLDKTLNELESTDVNQIDQGLNENNSNASSF